MKTIYTIGFTKKTAENFFCLLEKNSVATVVDVRLNNTSQLAAFSKFPDIKFFLHKIINADYIHDLNFAPSEDILNRYKKKIIDWAGYETEFFKLLDSRNIDEYIKKKYSDSDKICFLCSEPAPENCHRRLVAEKFSEVLGDITIVHL